VYGAGELYAVTGIAADIAREHRVADFSAAVSAIKADELSRLADRYLSELARRDPAAARVTDKMPENFLHVGIIAQLLPGACVIHVLRDPQDTCLSCYFQDFAGAHPYAYDLESLGFYYRGYERLMAHWLEVNPLPMLNVQYESLVANPEPEARRMVEFIGLQWDERCLASHRTRRVVVTASHDQVTEPIHTRAVERWRNYESALAPLRAALENAKGVY
jgi:hypothetical protein